jgi:hypothetical protein
VIYSWRLLNGQSASNALTAQYIWTNYQSQLSCFAIGNEPDWNSYHYPPFGTGTDPAITNYTSYLADWRSFAAAISNLVPSAKFAGPDTGSYTNSTYYNAQPWTRHFADDEKSSGRIAVVTQHYYVGGSPGSTTVQQALDHMLSADWDTTQYPWLYNNNIAAVVADGLPYRLSESNDYLTGITNASNAFASALWALDYMHWWAAHGCAGVNFHNKSWLKTDTIYLDTSSRAYLVNPKAFGIKAFDLGAHGFVQPATMTNLNKLNLTAYAVGNTTNLFITIINKEHGAGARDAAVTITPSGFSAASGAVMFLTASNGDVGATNGITLGGTSIANNAPWVEQWMPLSPPTNGQWLITVPAASAAVVKISAPVQQASMVLRILIPRAGQPQLTWTAGTLQSSTNVAGPYSDVPDANSPYTVTALSTQQFYRLRSATALNP